MEKNKEELIKYLDQNAQKFIDLSDSIWDFAELSLNEFKSAGLYCKMLRAEGFTVSENICGVPTAFSGSFGSGRPVIGILGEFDALDGLSQKGCSAKKEPEAGKTSGHGCGHNLLGAGALAAAFALKKYLSDTGAKGTVIFFGCPGEEGGAGKAFIAREGLWRELDSALTWHPESVNMVVSGSCISSIQKEYIFSGISSHAAGSPELGRSALDAVELMNIGVQYLREHMAPTARIHYAMTDCGGVSPNVVQSHASVLYMIRDHKVSDAVELQKRVDKIAEAAAMMTDTKLRVRFIDGTSNTVPNTVLEKILFENLNAVHMPEYNEAERAFASNLISSYETGKPKSPAEELADILEPDDINYVNQMSNFGAEPINRFIVPYRHVKKVSMGSTDVGDVSWQTPAVQLNAVCFASGSPGHSWQNVSCGKSSIAYKGMIFAAKVIACTALDLFENAGLVSAAKTEHIKATESGYVCPIPKDAFPTAL